MQHAHHLSDQLEYIRETISSKDYSRLEELINSDLLAKDKWEDLTTILKKYKLSFDAQLYLLDKVYDNRDQAYVYIPSLETKKESFLAKWMKQKSIISVKDFHQFSINHKDKFWMTIIDKMGIKFEQKYSKLMDISDSNNPKWLIDGKYNIVDNCLEHDKDKTAIIYADKSNKIHHFSYGQLTELVNKIASGLIKQGFKKGDRIAIDMPMTKEAVAIYLGIIKVGISVVSIADSFAPKEIKTRLDITDAKAVFTCDYINWNHRKIPLYEKVKEAHTKKIIVLCSEGSDIQIRDEDITFEAFLADCDTKVDSYAANAQDEINILFSSGTTGEPKAIVWNQSTPVKIFSDSLLHFDTNENDIWAWPTNLGWMMGPWVTLTALMHGATLALFYGAPTIKEFAQFIEQAGVTKLGVVPSIVSSLKSQGILDSEISWQSVKAFGSTGECSNFEDMFYLSSKANYAPVIEYCGGTEIGGAYISSTTIEPLIPSTFTTPTFGLDFCLLDENQKVIDQEGVGEVALIGPSFGLSQILLNKDHNKVYYDGMPKLDSIYLRRHGDEIERMNYHGHYIYRAQGRADDTMNLGGIKISSAEIERCVNQLPFVYETAAVGVNGHGGPSKLVIFAVLSSEIEHEYLKSQMQLQISKNLNPLFKVFKVIVIEELPRTASNKVIRRVLRM